MWKNIFTIFVVTLLCTFLMSSQTATAQQVFKTTSKSVIGYLEYLPADYNSNSDKYPIVIFLHGIGERCPNTTDIPTLQTAIQSVDNLGPPLHAKNGTQFPFILISPQLKNNYSSWPSSYVMEVIDHVKTYLRVDERRIHVTGLSLGGYGAWTMLQDYPSLFATGSPVCGGYNLPSKACGIAAENVPVWAFHGDADDVVNMSVTVKMVNAINACTPTPSPLAKLTIYPGVKHDAWNRAYRPDHTYHNPNVYEWLMTYTNTVNKGNKIPVANAGSDQTVSGSSMSLTASASDDGTIASYSWKKISGGAATLTNAATKTLSVSGLGSGSYMFKVTVIDNNGNSDSDYVKVTVSSSTNAAPVADAGSDVSLTPPTASVTITGSGNDSDGTIKTYRWSSVSGPATPTLANTSTATVTASNLTVAGTYVLSLTVTDDKGATATDNVSIRVKAVPVANAGPDKSLILPTTTMSLTGSGTDVDGTIASYKWSCSKGPVPPVISNATSSTASISGMTVAGQYVFALKVTDNDGLVDYDHITVYVMASSSTTATSLNEPATLYNVETPATESDRSEKIDLSTGGTEAWNDKNVIVYNESGSAIYSGAWSGEKYPEVFRQAGLYIYKVHNKDAQTVTGKILVRQ